MAKIYIQEPVWDKTTILRQTQGFTGCHCGHQFSSFPRDDYDYAYIQTFPNETASKVPREKRISFIFENPNIWSPDIEFYDHLGIIVSPYNLGFPDHVKWIRHHPCNAWFYGLNFRTDVGTIHRQSKTSSLCLEQLYSKSEVSKTGLISIIASSKQTTVGHAWRLEIARELQSYFGRLVDVYGFGTKAIEDKAGAIDKYQFSVVIENMSSPSYITEKVSDVLLGMTTPIYSGAEDINDYYSCDVPYVDFCKDPKATVRKIAKIIDEGPLDSKRRELLKNEVLFRNNLFSVIGQIIMFS